MVAEEGRAGKQTRVNCSAAQKEYLFAMWDKETPAVFLVYGTDALIASQ